MTLGLHDTTLADITELAHTAINGEGQQQGIVHHRAQPGLEGAGEEGIEGLVVSRIFVHGFAHVDAEASDK